MNFTASTSYSFLFTIKILFTHSTQIFTAAMGARNGIYNTLKGIHNNRAGAYVETCPLAPRACRIIILIITVMM
jgi:hypothetical protein